MNARQISLTILFGIILVATHFATGCTLRSSSGIKEKPPNDPTKTDTTERYTEAISPGWVEVEDPVSGMRFVVPCFWIVEFPPEGSRSLVSAGSIRNYPYLPWILSPDQDLFEEGAIKIDLVFTQRFLAGDTPIERMMALAEATRGSESESKLLSAEEIQVNGQTALYVQVESIFGLGRHVVFELSPGTFVIFAPNFLAFDHPNVQAILASFALSEDVAVLYPRIKPKLSPFGEAVACLETIED